MDRLDELCRDPALHVSMTLQPGDMQFVNNYHVLHGRDAYEDRRGEGQVRHLKRLWLETELLSDDAKPPPFRLAHGAGDWTLHTSFTRRRWRWRLVVLRSFHLWNGDSEQAINFRKDHAIRGGFLDLAKNI